MESGQPRGFASAMVSPGRWFLGRWLPRGSVPRIHISKRCRRFPRTTTRLSGTVTISWSLCLAALREDLDCWETAPLRLKLGSARRAAPTLVFSIRCSVPNGRGLPLPQRPPPCPSASVRALVFSIRSLLPKRQRTAVATNFYRVERKASAVSARSPQFLASDHQPAVAESSPPKHPQGIA